jgi:putative methionine-R-sulfoxide reductase with GAF domain
MIDIDSDRSATFRGEDRAFLEELDRQIEPKIGLK